MNHRILLPAQSHRQMLLVLALLASSGCGHHHPRGTEGPHRSGAHWGYADSVGPDHWGSLPGDEMCSAGKNQTPIALATASARREDLPKPTFSYAPTPLNMVNNGHTVQFDYASGSKLTVAGKEYALAQFHFHTPSEHTLDGVHYPLEMHLVHLGSNGKPALVVGVFFQKGAHNAALDAAFKDLPEHKDERKQPAGETISAAQLLPTDRTFFQYEGSLTTPPCSEGLQWYVMKTPIEMSAAQIKDYASLAHLNPSNRPLQPLNSRTVFLSATP